MRNYAKRNAVPFLNDRPKNVVGFHVAQHVVDRMVAVAREKGVGHFSLDLHSQVCGCKIGYQISLSEDAN
jgi:hypothetical protein